MALTLSKRMDIVEQKLSNLDTLPERMTGIESRMTGLELQFLQLREEMRAEFSAVRAEMRVSVDEAKSTLRDEIRAGDEETRRVLREETAALGTHMRVLHEEVITRISTIQEGRPDRRRPRR